MRGAGLITVAVTTVLAGGVLLPLATLTGCQSKSYEARYQLLVTEAVVEENAPEDGPRTDQLAVTIDWQATSGGLSANVSNPADTTVAILWERATFRYVSGEEEPLVATAPHQSPDLPQAPTMIPADGQMIVGMLPRSHAEWEWLPNRALGGVWKPVGGLFGVELPVGQSETELQTLAESAVGSKAVIRLSTRTGGRVLNYIYDVRVTGAEIRPAFR